MIKKDGIVKYTIPFYTIDGERYVKLAMVHRFKQYLLNELSPPANNGNGLKKEVKKKTKKQFTSTEIATMKALYESEKQTAWTIAKQYGCSETTVLRAVHGKLQPK